MNELKIELPSNISQRWGSTAACSQTIETGKLSIGEGN